jgi:uncharacterized protein (TIGR02118 family)
MLKMVYCLRRRADLPVEEFRRYWREVHAPLVRQHEAALGIRRYVQVHLGHSELGERLRSFRGAAAPYDGVAEIWYDSREALEAVGRTAEGRAASRILLEDEQRFVDHATSSISLGEEVEIIAGRSPPPD